MSLRLRTNQGYCTLLSAYAPTLLAEDGDKDEFYSLLEHHMLIASKGDCVIVLGDFNARVGADFRSWVVG